MAVIENLQTWMESASQNWSQERIVAHDQTIFSRRIFESPFHYYLEDKLADPEKARRIYQSFEKHLGPVLTPDERITLEHWILKNVQFIGALPFHHQWQGKFEPAVKAILYRHPERAIAFAEELRLLEKPCAFPVMRNPSEPKNIVIITTSGGGGHLSVSTAVEQILNKFPEKYRVTVIDVAKLFKPVDPLYRLSGLISSDEVYDHVYQQCSNVTLAHKLWHLSSTLNFFIEKEGGKILKDQIRLLKPDLILSSCHFNDRDLEIASSLGVPLRFIHCDYELSWALAPLISKINPQIVKFWLPATDPELLRPLSQKSSSGQVDHPPLDPLLAAKVKRVIEYSGYPVRSSFKRITDPQMIASLRQKYGIAKNSQIIILQMGRQGMGSLASIVKTLNENREVTYDGPLYIAVMCGTNEEMRKNLLAYFASTQNHPQIHFDILSLLDQNTAAEYLSIADAEIMKPGGATTGEALQTGVKTLIFVDPTLPWEGVNKDHMVRHDTGTVVQSLETIPLQLKEVLTKPKNHSYQPIDANKTIPILIDEAIHSFEEFLKI
jgi:processive 1,2-diacylglycerol beta-glucosyltransferase